MAKAYAELRSQGVAFPSRPTGPYIIMSQTQHVAEAQRDHALKIMEALLRAIRSFRRMPPELEPHKIIQDCLDKLNAWDAQLKQLQHTIDSERAKPAHDLPGIISPIRQGRSIDEALARVAADKAALGAPNPSSAPEANPLAQKEASEDTPWNNPHLSNLISPAPSLGLQDPDSQSGVGVLACDPELPRPNLDMPWNNLKTDSSVLPASSVQQQTSEDTPWNNSKNHPAALPAHPLDPQTIEETVWSNRENFATDDQWDFAQIETIPDTPWNNSQNNPPAPAALPAPSAQQETLEDTPRNNPLNSIPNQPRRLLSKRQ